MDNYITHQHLGYIYQYSEQNKQMLWKRHHSIYASSNQKPDIYLPADVQKNRNAIIPPLISTPQKTIDPLENGSIPKFVVRKSSKHKQHKQHNTGTFFLHRGNNHPIIKNVLQSMGYTETICKEQSCLIWYQGKQVPKRDFLKRQYNPKATNYLPNHHQITNKQKLFENISKYDPSCVGTFVPRTFIVDFKDNLSKVQANLSQFLTQFFKKNNMTKGPKKMNSLCISNFYGEICIPFVKILKSLNQSKRADSVNEMRTTKNNLWIVKPSFLNRGQGIEVISNLKQLQKILSQNSQQISVRMYQPQQKNIPNCFIIQQYIMDPLLYLGFKFDIRVWILLKNSKVNGLQVYIYKKAYSRLAGHKYTTASQAQTKQQQTGQNQLDDLDKKGSLSKSIQLSPTHKKQKSIKNTGLNDRFIHLTNNAVQKYCKQYGTMYEGNQLLVEQLVQKLAIPKLNQEYLFQNFKRILKVLIESAKQKLASKASYGNFQLMGLDFMIDSKLNVWLIQANCNPCLEQSSTILKNILPKMLKQLFQVVKIDKIMGDKEQKQQQIQEKLSFWEKVM